MPPKELADGASGPLDRASSRQRQSGWTRDPDRVRRNILDIAREEFAENGFSGARVDEIAARTATSKRMIYYYFTDKEGLYVAVLEEAYHLIRSLESRIDIEAMSPADALAALTALTFDHHAENPWFVRLVMVENIHQGRHLKRSEKIADLNITAIESLARTYARGVAVGAFRAGLDALQLHLTISALSFYNVSNRHSIREVFRHDMAEQQAHRQRRQVVIETLLRYVAQE